jgi:hypothetical protein
MKPILMIIKLGCRLGIVPPPIQMPNAANSRYLPNLSLFRRVHDSFYWSEKMKPAKVWCRHETYTDDNKTRVPTGHCSATKSNAKRRQLPVLA